MCANRDPKMHSAAVPSAASRPCSAERQCMRLFSFAPSHFQLQPANVFRKIVSMNFEIMILASIVRYSNIKRSRWPRARRTLSRTHTRMIYGRPIFVQATNNCLPGAGSAKVHSPSGRSRTEFICSRNNSLAFSEHRPER